LDLLDQFQIVARYVDFEYRFRKVEGWMPGLCGYALMLAAAYGPGAGEIVEIGSWMGKSTCWLAAGSKSARREKVHAIDTFDGGPWLKDQPAIRDEGTTYHRFVLNLEEQELFDHVEPVMATSQEAVRNWTKPIRLLFIDGDHSYEGVKSDFESWSRFLVANSLVAFDDVAGNYEGAKRYYDELLQRDARCREILRVGNMKMIQLAA
jgi:predicted O-methyltransferase YrrM